MLDYNNMSDGIKKAYKIASAAHNGQKDRANKDYILHPMTVASFLDGYEDEYIITALLHDVAEDTDITLEDLSKEFSKPVIDALTLLTHRKEVPYLEYIKNIKNSNNDIALKVKLADLRHNMDLSRNETVTENDLARMQNKYEPAKKILES